MDIPQSWAGRELELHIGSADKHDVTFFNEVKVGATGCGVEDVHWAELRKYSIPAGLVSAGRATLAVRVWSFVYDGGLRGPADAMMLFPADAPGEAITLAAKDK